MIVKVFLNADMRNGVSAFTEQLASDGVFIKKESHMIMFVNKKRNIAKIMWAGQYLLTIKKAQGRLTTDDITSIPKFFVTGKMLSAPIMKAPQKFLSGFEVLEHRGAV